MTRRSRAEEGEISDGSDSLEEITAEDFKHDEASARGSSRSSSRVWMPDTMRYPPSRSFAPNLYSFAWAQAVQNKPLGFGAVDPAAEKEVSCEIIADDSGEEVEKEEGELEEGEIEFGSELVVGETSDPPETKMEEEVKESEEEVIGEFDKRVSLILEELDNVTEDEIKASLEVVCLRLRKSYESLKKMFSESHVPVLDALVSQAFMGMQTVHSVVSSGNIKKNMDLTLRLLVHIKNQYSLLLSPEQLKELDTMVNSLVSDNKGGNMNDSRSHGPVSSEKPLMDTGAVSSIARTTGMAGLIKSGTPFAARNRIEFSPLLDLHADHDEGSLPSPTRDNITPLPMQKPIGFGMGTIMTTQPMPAKKAEGEDEKFRPYDTDSFKTVSSYQHIVRNSFVPITQLPSPTPSEDGNKTDDTYGEVSSSPVVDNVRTVVNPSSLQHPASCSTGAYTASSGGFPIAPVKTVGQLGLGPGPSTKAPAKSRDPRLRVLSTEAGGTPDPNRQPMHVDSNTLNVLSGSRKQKATDEPLLDEHALKRQRSDLSNTRKLQTSLGKGGWLEESSAMPSQQNYLIRANENAEVEIRKPGSGEVISNRARDGKTTLSRTNNGTGQNMSTNAPSVSLPSLLKDIAVNPAMLMQLIQMEQQRLVSQSQQKTTDLNHDTTSANRLHGTVSSVNGVSIKSLQAEQSQPGKPQVPPQSTSVNSQNDVGKIRMKPRDPRRILHSNVVQKCDNLKSEPSKISGNLLSDNTNIKDRVTVREQGEQAQTSSTTSLSSQSTVEPDITSLFTKNLMNLANMISNSQSANSLPAPPQNATYQIQNKVNKVNGKSAMADFNGQKAASSSSEGGMAGASQAPNPWGDLDHLLDGYDDKQKAAIQRERARRIEEQNKMFAARKLCLVLDLDHTLLNSAKFIEVDPVHDEILRKKEEQDRMLPYRHLFRFQHMAMWTKLRPGVWTFLERASKLYEMHLYTMGNKLYATEMAKVLDPSGTLFAGRVISRGADGDSPDADERVPKSKDLDGVLGMESAVVIIDDSVRVWPHNKQNLIVVERYTYFPCSRRQFGLLGPSLLEIDHDERPEDGTLASSLAVIERIHHNFFSHRFLNDVDVRNILAAEQRRILAGCRIVFSRVFPVGEVNPHMHPLWQTAEQFGAVCTNQIDEQVTHVVANSLGTDKVNWALSTGRFVVQPGWVEASALLYRRVNEHDFAVKQ